MPTAADFATLPRNIAIVALFNTLIAFGVSFASHGRFWESMIHSHAIGFSIFLPIDITRRLIWGDGKPARGQLLAIIGASIVGGFLVGNAIAGAFTGRPIFGERVFMSIAVTAFAGIALNWYFWSRERVAQLKLEAETVQRGAVEARLKLLQAQIEPHFLFNTLANLHSLISTDAARAQKMLEHLNDYLRATLDAARRDSGTLGEEFSLLRGYLEVLKVRMGPRLLYSLSIPEQLENCELPPMLLQPLVENAIKHGLEPKVEGGRIDVSASSEDGTVRIRVSDTGLGLGYGATRSTGVGLANIRDRLAAAYGGAASLEVAANPAGGVVATVKVPR
jgi:sensor histidine kinase YesM